ncbi:MAG: 50S ribosomal protein L3 [Chloroflexi bacterium]|nr:50S ribosomal protein L3 [Chloroflexota bacterium]|tara:strand:+ start:29074 stop:29706 length:633 start_codon:yes stop_codon:yes gene_type:complete
MSVQGLIGKKIGTTQVFRDDKSADCVTVIRVDSCVVTQIKTIEKDGYSSVQIGTMETGNASMPMKGHMGETSFKVLKEFSVIDSSEINKGDVLDVGIFQIGERVNVTALSKGRGFAGGVKRHGFHGGPKTHGQSDRHRAPGSVGAGSSPGRVFKGKKMAGHYGAARVTVRNLEVVLADVSRGVILLKGAVPGHRNSLVSINKSSFKGGLK